jgi:thiamine biosynthesis protein ThiS
MSSTTAAKITVNGALRDIEPGMTVDALLTQLGVRRELIAVEVNRRLVRRTEHVSRALLDGDQVEVVEFVGGG